MPTSNKTPRTGSVLISSPLLRNYGDRPRFFPPAGRVLVKPPVSVATLAF
jgi:hypothetical protein